jgi:hypothetical protein
MMKTYIFLIARSLMEYYGISIALNLWVGIMVQPPRYIAGNLSVGTRY